ncbi:hypothetical protein GQ55_3G110900 [Panicum hallii var. hallii]|uniref:Uncharacterized protein n=1 Tax=Panicum hallii var. hallii TaxID=1504633 RepID=A0A2T7E868_9POAL|nr:hypothetical protein GQ55_3G110900 [Panicum hallii var. hallii]
MAQRTSELHPYGCNTTVQNSDRNPRPPSQPMAACRSATRQERPSTSSARCWRNPRRDASGVAPSLVDLAIDGPHRVTVDVLYLLDSKALRGTSGAVRIAGAVSVHAGVGSSSDTPAITSRPCACSHSIAFA